MPPFQQRAVTVKGLAVPVIVLCGPSGVGKSLLALKIAQILLRGESAPNVLLIDGDMHSCGLTLEIEGVANIRCGHLHDVIVGHQPTVGPADLTSIHPKPRKWDSLPGEGRLFFLPSRHREATAPWDDLGQMDRGLLQRLLHEAIGYAANRVAANCIVVDTTSIPEPCSAALISLSDLVFLVGSELKPRVVIDRHRRELQTLGAPLKDWQVEIIYNQCDPIGDEPWLRPTDCFIIPRFGRVNKDKPEMDAEALADAMELDRLLIAILTHVFRQRDLRFDFPWHACLPVEWREPAKQAGNMPPPFHRLCPRCDAQWMFVGLLAVAGLIWAFFFSQACATLKAPAVLAPASIGLVALFYAAPHILRGIMDFRTSLALRACSKKEDCSWILSRLRMKPMQLQRTPQEKKRKILDLRLQSLRRAFANLPQSASGPHGAPEKE